jgi:hypothetical protein
VKPSPTLCPVCGKRCSGRRLPADQGECPACRKHKKADPEPRAAKFAPGRGGRIVPNLGTDVPEPEEDET